MERREQALLGDSDHDDMGDIDAELNLDRYIERKMARRRER